MANDDAWNAGWAAGQGGGKKKKKKPGKGGGSTSSSSSSGGGDPWSILGLLPKLHKGGKVKKTGAYRLKRGETVVTGKQMKAIKGNKKVSRKKVTSKV